jgi:hypothetical protein
LNAQHDIQIFNGLLSYVQHSFSLVFIYFSVLAEDAIQAALKDYKVKNKAAEAVQ